MVVPVPIPRHGDKPQLQVGHRHEEAGVLEVPRYDVEFVELWKAKLDCTLCVPRRHQRALHVNAHDREIRPAWS